MDNKAQEIYNKISNSGSDAKNNGKKAIISGAAVGAAFGFYYGYSRKKNILVMGVAGAIVGALVAKILMPK